MHKFGGQYGQRLPESEKGWRGGIGRRLNKPDGVRSAVKTYGFLPGLPHPGTTCLCPHVPFLLFLPEREISSVFLFLRAHEP